MPTDADDADAGLHHGFKGAQIAASALTAKALHLTTPVSSTSGATPPADLSRVFYLQKRVLGSTGCTRTELVGLPDARSDRGPSGD
jgi:hypothetical protein